MCNKCSYKRPMGDRPAREGLAGCGSAAKASSETLHGKRVLKEEGEGWKVSSVSAVLRLGAPRPAVPGSAACPKHAERKLMCFKTTQPK